MVFILRELIPIIRNDTIKFNRRIPERVSMCLFECIVKFIVNGGSFLYIINCVLRYGWMLYRFHVHVLYQFMIYLENPLPCCCVQYFLIERGLLGMFVPYH